MASYLSSLFTSKEYSSEEETDSESIGSVKVVLMKSLILN